MLGQPDLKAPRASKGQEYKDLGVLREIKELRDGRGGRGGRETRVGREILD